MQNLKTINYLTCTEHSCTVHSLNLQIKIQSDQIKQLNYEEQNLRKIRKKWTNCYNKVQKKSKLCNQNYLKYILHWVVINMKIPTWNWKYKTYKDNWRHLIVLKVSRKTQNRDELKENIGSNQQELIRSLTNGILSIHMLFPFIHSRLYPSHLSTHPFIFLFIHPFNIKLYLIWSIMSYWTILHKGMHCLELGSLQFDWPLMWHIKCNIEVTEQHDSLYC